MKNTPRSRDGFTLVEILVVVVILGILASVTVFAIRGITDRGEVNSCAVDRRTMGDAADFYLVDQSVAAIPATGTADADQFERTLVAAELLIAVSTYHDLAADGTVTTTGAPCP